MTDVQTLDLGRLQSQSLFPQVFDKESRFAKYFIDKRWQKSKQIH